MSSSSADASVTSTGTPTLPPNPDALLNVEITPELVARHGIREDEFGRIREILGRDPNLTELGIFSVMWSEHCSYKNSRPLLKLFPTEKADKAAPGQILVKAGEENAGVVDIGDGWAICFKIESHNHPSAVEPYEGAATGVGGILRDIFTMGARPIALSNSLRFGELESPAARRLFRGVVHGIAGYGNCMGIPNIGGDVYFDSCYEGNPLVNALCLGALRTGAIQRGAATGLGNPVYYVGAATGRDGLGGAAFASRELTEESAEDRPAVQKGDPFMEKLLMEACLEMMAIPGLVVGIQDMGAAGLTCSSCETASRGGTGIEIDLDQVPQRETGMNSYEIMLSESQERMLVIVEAGREGELEAVFEKWDLHATRVGEVTATGRMVVRHKGVVVADIPARSLAEEGPVYQREASEPAYLQEVQAWRPDALEDLAPEAIGDTLSRLLSTPTIASKAWVYRQYDHMVMHSTVLEPGSDAGVVRIRTEAGDRFVALANDCNNRYCYLNPYRGGLIAMAECLRNLACSGARPLAMTDNLNFGNPYKPEVFFMMREAVRGLADACRHFDVPVCGGNVSLYNENPEGAIDPTPVVAVAGLIESRDQVTGSTLSRGDETLILLGGLPDELGGSQYLKCCHGLKTGDAPALDLESEQRLHRFILDQIASGRVTAAHDPSEGGLLVALLEMLFAPDATYGARIRLDLPAGARLDATLFGESQSRAILAVAPELSDAVLAAARTAEVPACVLGEADTGSAFHLEIAGIDGRLELSVPLLRRAWEEAIPRAMEV